MSGQPLEGICRSPACRRRILWAETSKGNRMPVDPTPTPETGNVILEPRPGRLPLAQVLAGSALDDARAMHLELHHSHFATCPAAAEHRGRR